MTNDKWWNSILFYLTWVRHNPADIQLYRGAKRTTKPLNIHLKFL